jgi:hypothetical protein
MPANVLERFGWVGDKGATALLPDDVPVAFQHVQGPYHSDAADTAVLAQFTFCGDGTAGCELAGLDAILQGGVDL